MTFVGPAKNPIWIGTRREKKALMINPDFPWLYEVWRNVHLWGQWPDGLPWNRQDGELVDIINTVEMMYRNHFDAATLTMKNTSDIAAYTKVLAQGKRIM